MLNSGSLRGLVVLSVCLSISATCLADVSDDFAPVQMVQASGFDIDVPGYSVPSYVDWNEDGLKDLIVGEGSGSTTPGVRVYLNDGSAQAPSFSDYFMAQADGANLTAVGSGCMGLFPRVGYWDDDGLKDLIVGQSNGTLKFYRNIGTDEAPTFDAGTLLQTGIENVVTMVIDVGNRACPDLVDWNNDGVTDLVIGAYDSQIRMYSGGDSNALLGLPAVVQNGGGNLTVPGNRASPVVVDFDGDGLKDIIAGNTYGQLLLYTNVGTDAEPVFDGYRALISEGLPIDLASTRSRPFVGDWTGDGAIDVLIGASDGRVYLYQGIPEPATLSVLAMAGLAMLRRRKR